MRSGAKRQRTYALGDSQQELERLVAQARLLAPFTRQLFQQAGITASMRVLDVGCGAGDVSFLVSELVGKEGTVIGVDVSAAAIEYATQRARGQAIANVQFVVGDPSRMAFHEKFDAVVGRFVLMYCPDLAFTLAKLADHVRPGGIVVFQEFDMTSLRSLPSVRTFQSAVKWMKRAFIASGARIDMGLQLYSALLSTGLSEPSLRADVFVGGGIQFPCEVFATTVQNLLPAMKKMGLAGTNRSDFSSLAKRMRNEMLARKAIAFSPRIIGAWSHKRTSRTGPAHAKGC